MKYVLDLTTSASIVGAKLNTNLILFVALLASNAVVSFAFTLCAQGDERCNTLISPRQRRSVVQPFKRPPHSILLLRGDTYIGE